MFRLIWWILHNKSVNMGSIMTPKNPKHGGKSTDLGKFVINHTCYNNGPMHCLGESKFLSIYHIHPSNRSTLARANTHINITCARQWLCDKPKNFTQTRRRQLEYLRIIILVLCRPSCIIISFFFCLL